MKRWWLVSWLALQSALSLAWADMGRVVLFDGKHYVWAQVAQTPHERARGLMFRTYLLPFEGMLFAFEETAEVSFWMKNTMIPLQMRFYDERLRLVHYVPHATPCYALPCASYPSERKARFVLETRAHRAHFGHEDLAQLRAVYYQRGK